MATPTDDLTDHVTPLLTTRIKLQSTLQTYRPSHYFTYNRTGVSFSCTVANFNEDRVILLNRTARECLPRAFRSFENNQIPLGPYIKNA